MNKTIGILAHVDAGKTTFAEQILYYTNSIRNRGRVDHKNAFLDCHSIEKGRGITVFSDQGIFNYNNSTYYLIDTPGHIDFSQEMERAIQIMDYAVIIVSAVEGVQAHTETVWRLLRKHKIPTFFFINKIDRIGADINRVLKEIALKLTANYIFLTETFKENQLDKELIEFIAEQDEYLFDKYLQDKYEKNLWIDSMRDMIKDNKIFPAFSGSALEDIGIEEFLYKLDMLTFTQYNTIDDFSGRVYKIRYDEKGTRITYIKALSGYLRVKEEIIYGDNVEDVHEKVNEIRIYNGNKYKIVDKVSAGDTFAVVGLTKVIAGDGLGGLKEKVQYDMVPTLKSKVIFGKSINIKDILNCFKILESEDPTLNVLWNEKLQEIDVHIMGTIQLEVLKQLVEDRFKFVIDFGPCEILYKETIKTATIGYGHFEPLGHYSEVNLKIEPGQRNSGILFKSICHVDNLALGNQNLVHKHIYEKEHRGILTGSPITDLKITLLDGRAHNKHTSGGDFREATYRALRQGLEKVENIILEPYYKFKIEVEIEYIGKVISDIQRLKGSFNLSESIKNRVIITGRGPVATFMNYNMELISFTKGKGTINFIFDGYDNCHNEGEIIKIFNYDKNSDEEYTSNSIFCSKGQGYIVEGNKCENYMHCLKR